jgi:hypothetical protein
MTPTLGLGIVRGAATPAASYAVDTECWRLPTRVVPSLCQRASVLIIIERGMLWTCR